MRSLCGLLGIFAITCLATADEPPLGKWLPPAPARVDREDEFPSLTTRLNDQLLQLDSERKALGAAHDTVAREYEQGIVLSTAGSGLLRLRVKQLLVKLKHPQGGSIAPSPPSTTEPELPQVVKTPAPSKEKQPEKFPLLPPKESSDTSNTRPVDPLALAHALFRSGNYERALQAFEMIDLRGTKADQRAPIEYLMASCLHRMGKTKEANARYLQIANTKGDELVAACAQYQIAALRWHTEVQDQLTEIKQRRLALEKQP